METRQRIFLAHAREDEAQVRTLYHWLKERGFDPWLDKLDLLPGQLWRDEIPKAIAGSAVFLACLSKQSVQKESFLRREFRTALETYHRLPKGRVYLIPVRLDECDVPDIRTPDFEIGLRDFHWVDLFEEGGSERLNEAITMVLEGVPVSRRFGPGQTSEPVGASHRNPMVFAAWITAAATLLAAFASPLLVSILSPDHQSRSEEHRTRQERLRESSNDKKSSPSAIQEGRFEPLDVVETLPNFSAYLRSSNELPACSEDAARICTAQGFMYFAGSEILGLKISPDYNKARRLFENGCNVGDELGCSGLGMIYQEGLGVSQDSDKARRLFQQACNGGDDLGCFALGALYVAGLGVSQDYDQAQRLFQKVCTDDDNVHGCAGLADLYHEGLVFSQDYDKALRLYQQACNGEDAGGCTGLGDLYYYGRGVSLEYGEARRLYQRACNGGDEDGCFNLGSLYDDGRGVSQDYAEARRYYQKACEGGSMPGCHNFGWLYDDGRGVSQDYVEARRYYQKACDGGDAHSCTDLGGLYHEGLGVSQDLDKAKTLYQKACDGGEEYGCSEAKRLAN